MKTWTLLACGLLAAAVASAAPVGSRFSDRLSEADIKACGIDQLSSDQVAALNALIRRAAAVALDASAASPSKPFSQRLLPDEFRTAGLDHLTSVQLAALNRLADETLNPPAPSSLAAAGPGPAPMAIETEDERTAPEIHGMVSLTYGFGHGTSEREATTALNYVDPTHHFEIGVSYSDWEGKSPYGCVNRLP